MQDDLSNFKDEMPYNLSIANKSREYTTQYDSYFNNIDFILNETHNEEINITNNLFTNNYNVSESNITFYEYFQNYNITLNDSSIEIKSYEHKIQNGLPKFKDAMPYFNYIDVTLNETYDKQNIFTESSNSSLFNYTQINEKICFRSQLGKYNYLNESSLFVFYNLLNEQSRLWIVEEAPIVSFNEDSEDILVFNCKNIIDKFYHHFENINISNLFSNTLDYFDNCFEFNINYTSIKYEIEESKLCLLISKNKIDFLKMNATNLSEYLIMTFSSILTKLIDTYSVFVSIIMNTVCNDELKIIANMFSVYNNYSFFIKNYLEGNNRKMITMKSIENTYFTNLIHANSRNLLISNETYNQNGLNSFNIFEHNNTKLDFDVYEENTTSVFNLKDYSRESDLIKNISDHDLLYKLNITDNVQNLQLKSNFVDKSNDSTLFNNNQTFKLLTPFNDSLTLTDVYFNYNNKNLSENNHGQDNEQITNEKIFIRNKLPRQISPFDIRNISLLNNSKNNETILDTYSLNLQNNYSESRILQTKTGNNLQSKNSKAYISKLSISSLQLINNKNLLETNLKTDYAQIKDLQKIKLLKIDKFISKLTYPSINSSKTNFSNIMNFNLQNSNKGFLNLENIKLDDFNLTNLNINKSFLYNTVDVNSTVESSQFVNLHFFNFLINLVNFNLKEFIVNYSESLFNNHTISANNNITSSNLIKLNKINISEFANNVSNNNDLQIKNICDTKTLSSFLEVSKNEKRKWKYINSISINSTYFWLNFLNKQFNETNIKEYLCNSGFECLSFINNSRCFNSTCSCQSGYKEIIHNNRIICRPRELGDLTCKNKSDCNDSISNSFCDLNLGCVCSKGYVENRVKNICAIRFIGDNSSCSDFQDCNSTIENSLCYNKRCSCNTGYIETANSSKCRPRVIGDPCNKSINCYKIINSQCQETDRKCQCLSGYAQSNTSYCQKRKIGDMCDIDSDCMHAVGNSLCKKFNFSEIENLSKLYENQTIVKYTKIYKPYYNLNYTNSLQNIYLNYSISNISNFLNSYWNHLIVNFLFNNIKMNKIEDHFNKNNNVSNDLVTCQCKMGFKEDENLTLCSKRLIGDDCLVDEDCFTSVNCSVCNITNRKCVCDYDHMSAPNKTNECIDRPVIEQYNDKDILKKLKANYKCQSYLKYSEYVSNCSIKCDNALIGDYWSHGNKDCKRVFSYIVEINASEIVGRYERIPLKFNISYIYNNFSNDYWKNAFRIELNGIHQIMRSFVNQNINAYQKIAKGFHSARLLNFSNIATNSGIRITIALFFKATNNTSDPSKSDINTILMMFKLYFEKKEGEIGMSKIFVQKPYEKNIIFKDMNECTITSNFSHSITAQEISDCHVDSICHNIHGKYGCICEMYYKDKSPDKNLLPGRECSYDDPDKITIDFEYKISSVDCSEGMCETPWPIVIGVTSILFGLLFLLLIVEIVWRMKQLNRQLDEKCRQQTARYESRLNYLKSKNNLKHSRGLQISHSSGSIRKQYF